MTVVQEAPVHTPELQAQYTSPVDLDRNIRHELSYSAFVDVPNLVESLFSGPRIDQTVDEVYDKLKEAKTYLPKSKGSNDKSQWANFPLQPATEKEIYEPLVNVLNAITTQVKDPQMPIVWLNKHNSWMQSDFKDRLLPDIVALCLEQGTNVEDYLSELKEGKWEAWWRLVHTPLEVKKDNGYVPSVLQTFKYGRQTLKEQPDRRFVFALLFTRSEIRFWLLDRSGALGSKLVDIHANPKTLIRIVVGLMTNTPSELGWDPTMQQYIDGERKPSYNIPRTMKSKYHVAHERKWSVVMPKPKPHYTTDAESKVKPAPVIADPDAEMEEFILHRAISLSHAEVIRGRCTRIWLAWLASDMEIDEKKRKVYVFKDSWRDSRRRHEGELYAIGCTDDKGKPVKVGGIPEVYSCGVVCVDGQEDSTKTLIRKGLKDLTIPDTQPLVLDGATLPDGEAFLTKEHDSMNIPKLDHSAVQHLHVAGRRTGNEKPRNRIHSRLVLATSGWPIFKFKSLPELFGALSDVVAGHRHLCGRGVLHRDMSPGNIVITGLESPDSGILIDLDYGIEYPRTEAAKDDDELSGTIHFMSGELLSNEAYSIGKAPVISSLPEVAEWNPVIGLLEDEEVGAQARVVAPAAKVEHAPHHDLEALFWTFCYLCLTREGPGAIRSTWPSDLEEHRALLRTLRDCFYKEDISAIAPNKAVLMSSPDIFEKKILDSFAPYFKHCAFFARHLYQALYFAYKSGNFDNLHDIFEATFRTAAKSRVILEWHSKNEAYKEMEKQEEKRREEDKKGNFDSPHQIDVTKFEHKLKGKGKRARDASMEGVAAESTTSTSRQLKRRKSGSLDSDPLSSPSSKPAKRRARKAKADAMREGQSSSKHGRSKRPKNATASSSQQSLAGPSRKQRRT